MEQEPTHPFTTSIIWIQNKSGPELDYEKELEGIRFELEELKELTKFYDNEIYPEPSKSVYIAYTTEYKMVVVVLSTSKHKIDESGEIKYPVSMIFVKGPKNEWVPESTIHISKIRRFFKLQAKPETFVRSVLGDIEVKKVMTMKPGHPNATSLFINLHEFFEQEYARNTSRKVGMMLQLPEQDDETDMFQNRSTPAFEAFQDLFTKEICLNGYKGYCGGLDVTGRCGSGKTTRIMKVFDTTILFHVSTLLPYTKNDPQQLRKKRHIGNDNIVVVFQDNSSLSPKEYNERKCVLKYGMVKSQVIHLYVLVTMLPYADHEGAVVECESTDELTEEEKYEEEGNKTTGTGTGTVTPDKIEVIATKEEVDRHGLDQGGEGDAETPAEEDTEEEKDTLSLSSPLAGQQSPTTEGPDCADGQHTEATNGLASGGSVDVGRDDQELDELMGRQRSESVLSPTEEMSSSGPRTKYKFADGVRFQVNIIRQKILSEIPLKLPKRITEGEGLDAKELKRLLKVLMPSMASAVWNAPILHTRVEKMYEIRINEIVEKISKK